jgi:hypothetical protein
MPFQFQCPQGHLLEADESQVGQQCQCPMCGQLFAIPAPAGAAPFPAPGGFAPPPAEDPAAAFDFSRGRSSAAAPFSQPEAPRMLHIPCPRGHELEVPPEMLGQDVLCPHCQTQFHLRDRDSIEYKQRKQKEIELKDYKRGQLWMMWAIIIATVVVLGLAILIGIRATQ